MRFHRNFALDLILEANACSQPAGGREEAVIKSFPPAQPSASEIKCQPLHEDQIEVISGNRSIRCWLQNPEPSGLQFRPAGNPVELEILSQTAG